MSIVSCAVLLLLGSRIAVAEVGRNDSVLASEARSGEVIPYRVSLSGYPKSKPPEQGGRGWVRAALETPRGSVPVVLWFDEETPERWRPGTELHIKSSIERLPSVSSAAYGLSVRTFSEIETKSDVWLEDWAASVRGGLRAIAKAIPGAELVPGLAVGDTALVGERLESTMQDSSLTHLTAVSGANCALVTGAIVALLTRLGLGRRLRTVAAGAGLLGFVVLVGPDPSVLRAALMAAVMLLSGFGGKRVLAFPSLGLAMLILLVVDPWQSLQAGFALSVAATSGILAIGSPCVQWLRKQLRIPKLLALPIAIAFAAQLFCGPILILLQPGIPSAGIVANVIAGPAAPIGTGLGLVGAVFAPIAPEVAHLFVVLASFPARWIAATAEVVAALPLGRWYWPQGWSGALLLALCELACATAWLLHRGHLSVGGVRTAPRQPWRSATARPPRITWLSTVLVCGGVGMFVAASVAVPFTTRLGTPGDWAVVACDVGQGDAILLRDPSHPDRVMLVDTGDDPEKLASCMQRFDVDRIGQLVLTHDDRDHVGALGAIVERVDAALVAPDNREDQSAGLSMSSRAPIRALERAGVPVTIGVSGHTGGFSTTDQSSGLRWQVLAPPPMPTPANTNAASLVLRVDIGRLRVLLLADTGLEEQQALQRRLGERAEDTLRVDVLKVAHHGSRDQDQHFPELIGAKWALISVGAENSFGHPTSETLAALLRAGTTPLRTDQLGSIAIRAPERRDPDMETDFAQLEVWVERGAS